MICPTSWVHYSKITCTGPDQKQFQTTQKECDDFNRAWGNVPRPSTILQPTTVKNTAGMTEQEKRQAEQYLQQLRDFAKQTEQDHQDYLKAVDEYAKASTEYYRLQLEQAAQFSPTPQTFEVPAVYADRCRTEFVGLTPFTEQICEKVCVANCK